MEAEINMAYREAAGMSGATPDDIRRWVDRFVYYGRAGLSAEIAFAAGDCPNEIEGTWELISRYSNGERTASRARLYYDVNRRTNEADLLITHVTERNHFARDAGEFTFLMIALTRLKFTQKTKYEVELTTKGQLIGNFGPYLKMRYMEDRATLVKFEHHPAMVGYPEAYWIENGKRVPRIGGFLLVKVAGSPMTYHEQGFPEMLGFEKTFDTVDTYTQIGTEKPLIGGWEPITEYFKRMSDPSGKLAQLRKRGLRGEALTFFQDPPKRSELRRYVKGL